MLALHLPRLPGMGRWSLPRNFDFSVIDVARAGCEIAEMFSRSATRLTLACKLNGRRCRSPVPDIETVREAPDPVDAYLIGPDGRATLVRGVHLWATY
jgi:hypothetical protein